MWLQGQEEGASFCPFQGSEWQRELCDNSAGVLTREFVCHWFSWSWAGGEALTQRVQRPFVLCVKGLGSAKSGWSVSIIRI